MWNYNKQDCKVAYKLKVFARQPILKIDGFPCSKKDIPGASHTF